MNVREDDRVSAVALVVESEGATAAGVVEARRIGRSSRDAIMSATAGVGPDASADGAEAPRTADDGNGAGDDGRRRGVATLGSPEKGGGPYL